MTRNVLALIHGMVPARAATTSKASYETFWNGILREEPSLEGMLERREVEWGHELPGEPARSDDQKLTRAQLHVAGLVECKKVRSRPSERNVVMEGVLGRDYGVPGLRQVQQKLREEIVQFGLADALYYAAPDGEERVRQVVYQQVLDALGDPAADQPVRLHVVAHSLGVAVAHDFLFGLFKPNHEPGFLTQATDDCGQRYTRWRERARAGRLALGTFVSMASQLPIFVMRKQALVDTLFDGGLLDPSVIGVTGPGVQWLNFYDIDDVLGFATRPLYGDHDAIKEIQVDTGDLAATAHTGYWGNETVTRETAKQLRANCSS